MSEEMTGTEEAYNQGYETGHQAGYIVGSKYGYKAGIEACKQKIMSLNYDDLYKGNVREFCCWELESLLPKDSK